MSIEDLRKNIDFIVENRYYMFQIVSDCFRLFQIVSDCLFQFVSICFNLFHAVADCFRKINVKNLEKFQEKFLTFRKVTRLTGLSRQTIWRHQKIGMFPASKKISSHRVAFLLSDIDNWMRTER